MPNSQPYKPEQDNQAGGMPRTPNAEYHSGDHPFQFPWWAIITAFIFGAWPVAIVFIVLNRVFRDGNISWNSIASRSRGSAPTIRRTSSGHVYGTPPAYVQEPGEAQQAAPQAAPPPPPPTPAAPVYAGTAGKKAKPASRRATPRRSGDAATADQRLAAVLLVVGIIFAICGVFASLDGLDSLLWGLRSGSGLLYWIEDLLAGLMMLGGGLGMCFGANRIRTSRRMRKKIQNIVGNADYMYIEDIAASVPCSYEKCCKHLESCIDKGVFGPGAYLDMRTRCLVVTGKPPQEAAEPAPQAAPVADAEQSGYEAILLQLRRINEAIPDEEMSDKISRLEKVSAKIFAQAKDNPDKLPQMRKFMDYYLPTSLKLLKTYAELEAQGIEGSNISESKRRIEQSMDTLVRAFEAQLDKLFQEDALDVSTDLDVMEQMLRADGLTGDDPFGLGAAPNAPEPPKL